MRVHVCVYVRDTYNHNEVFRVISIVFRISALLQLLIQDIQSSIQLEKSRHQIAHFVLCHSTIWLWRLQRLITKG